MSTETATFGAEAKKVESIRRLAETVSDEEALAALNAPDVNMTLGTASVVTSVVTSTVRGVLRREELEEEEHLSPEELASVRRGLEEIQRGEFITLEEYERKRQL